MNDHPMSLSIPTRKVLLLVLLLLPLAIRASDLKPVPFFSSSMQKDPGIVHSFAMCFEAIIVNGPAGNHKGSFFPVLLKSQVVPHVQPVAFSSFIRAGASSDNNPENPMFVLIDSLSLWNMWWIYVFLAALLLAGLIFINNYRIRNKLNRLMAIEQIKKREHEKIQKKVAMDFHDEVGNHLTSISILIELIRNKDWEIPPDLEELLNKIDLESRQLFTGTKDFIWSMDPANDNLMAVFNHIKDYGVELFGDSKINFQARSLVPGLGQVSLQPGFTRQIVLIFKEGLHNAFMHAACRNVHFSMNITGDELDIILKDDGKGFNAEELAYYEGIKKMRFRGRKIKSDLKLSSDPENGTKIMLRAVLNS